MAFHYNQEPYLFHYSAFSQNHLPTWKLRLQDVMIIWVLERHVIIFEAPSSYQCGLVSIPLIQTAYLIFLSTLVHSACHCPILKHMYSQSQTLWKDSRSLLNKSTCIGLEFKNIYPLVSVYLWNFYSIFSIIYLHFFVQPDNVTLLVLSHPGDVIPFTWNTPLLRIELSKFHQSYRISSESHLNLQFMFSHFLENFPYRFADLILQWITAAFDYVYMACLIVSDSKQKQN